LSDEGSSNLQPLERATLDAPVARRIDAMLERLNAYDFLAALALAESVRIDAPEHELAAVCRKEALSVLHSFLESPVRIARTDTGGLSEDAFTLLMASDGCTPASLLPAEGIERVRALHALHDLVRLEYFETRENTFVEAMVSPDEPRVRIEERANAAARDELRRVLELFPNERFGIGRCDEIDFSSLWRTPEFAAAKEILPLAVGTASDMIRRENDLKLHAHDAYVDRFILLAAKPPTSEEMQVLYVIIAP